jgi:hypothetical protein
MIPFIADAQKAQDFFIDQIGRADLQRYQSPLREYLCVMQLATSDYQGDLGATNRQQLFEAFADFVLSKRKRHGVPASLRTQIIVDTGLLWMQHFTKATGIENPDGDIKIFSPEVAKKLSLLYQRTQRALSGWPGPGSFFKMDQLVETIESSDLRGIKDQMLYDLVGGMQYGVAAFFVELNPHALDALLQTTQTILARPVSDEIKPFLAFAHTVDDFRLSQQLMIETLQTSLPPDLQKITLIPDTRFFALAKGRAVNSA